MTILDLEERESATEADEAGLEPSQSALKEKSKH